jgi:hypothetical protein
LVQSVCLEQSNVEGAKAHDDFTSSILGHDVILDAKRRFAGVSALARWNWSRGGWRLIACIVYPAPENHRFKIVLGKSFN